MENPLVKWSEAEKAWLACAIDAEGSIIFSSYTQPNVKTGRIQGGFQTRVYLCNTCIEFVQHFATLTGSKILVRHPHAKRLSKKDLYEINIITKKTVMELLTAVRPYLIVKRAKADALLAYIAKNPLDRIGHLAKLNQLPKDTLGHPIRQEVVGTE